MNEVADKQGEKLGATRADCAPGRSG